MTDRQLLAVLTTIIYPNALRWCEDSALLPLDYAVRIAREIMLRTGATEESLKDLPK